MADVEQCLRTLRLKVKAEGYAWLNAAATEVNQVWNYANATSYKAARPFAGSGKWLSAFDLNNLTAGATEYFDHIGSETILRVNAEIATRRKQFKKVQLRWRVSRGSKRSLGCIPFKAAQLKRKGKSLRFSGKTFRVFECDLLKGAMWKSGCFAQDAVGDWWLCLPVACSSCKALTGPTGLDMLVVRTWVCRACGDTHDRDVNSALNHLSAVSSPPSVSGNEPPIAVAEPSFTYSLCEARISALKAAA